MLIGIAMAKGYATDLETFEGLGAAIGTKTLTKTQKRELLNIIAFVRAKAFNVNFSLVEMQTLESKLRHES